MIFLSFSSPIIYITPYSIEHPIFPAFKYHLFPHSIYLDRAIQLYCTRHAIDQSSLPHLGISHPLALPVEIRDLQLMQAKSQSVLCAQVGASCSCRRFPLPQIGFVARLLPAVSRRSLLQLDLPGPSLPDESFALLLHLFPFQLHSLCACRRRGCRACWRGSASGEV